MTADTFTHVKTVQMLESKSEIICTFSSQEFFLLILYLNRFSVKIALNGFLYAYIYLTLKRVHSFDKPTHNWSFIS